MEPKSSQPPNPPLDQDPEVIKENKQAKKDRKALKRAQGQNNKAFMDMLRNASRNHYTLNQMVDRKARILLSVNALLLSLIIGRLISNTEMQDWKFPLFVLMGLICFVSILYAMFAVIPEKSLGNLDENSIKQKIGNPLFFGNFREMPLQQYENAMMEMQEDIDFIHRSMIQDIYQIGQVLDRKRQFLRTSLLIFIIGLCVTLVFSFILHSALG